MVYKVEFSDKARKQIKKISTDYTKKIINFLENKASISPYKTGKKLKGNLKEFWRYRIEDYRIICNIQDKKLVILVVEVAHRSKIYK